MFLFAYLKTPLTMNIHSENNHKPDTDSFTKQDKKTGKSCSVALFFFFHFIRQCPGDQILIGHGVPMMQN